MHPTPRAFHCLGLGIAVALLPAIAGGGWWPLWVAYLLGFGALVTLEALWLVAPHRVLLESTAPERLYIGSEGEWRIRLAVEGATSPTTFELVAEIDAELEPQPPRRVRVAGGAAAKVRFALRPRRRGTLAIDGVWLRWTGPFGLLRLIRRHAIDRRIDVVPDTGQVRATALRFFSSPSAMAGLKTERYVGDGSEFESLRPYVSGLDPRGMDWKASARHRRLLCRRFRAERNHQVILTIDCGHLMGEPLAGLPRLDHAINQALLLGYFCLKTGDRIGLYAFDAKPRAYLAPRGGLPAFAWLQASTARIDYGTAETNYTLGLLELTRRLQRRSLIVVFTEFVDIVTAQLMLDNLDRLARRHVVVFVALRDPGLLAIERAEPQRLADVGRAVVAAELDLDRERVLARLRRGGIHVVDALPDVLSVRLLDRYFEIKRRELVA
jgi:uncharacterized protein (DUF58 family)